MISNKIIASEKNASDKNPNPKFTGLFIPVEILEMEELTHTDHMLLAWIDALYSEEDSGCFASNEYFAKKLKVTDRSIRSIIAKLIDLGLVEKVSFNGRTRVIRACKERWFKQDPFRADRKSTSGQTRSELPGREDVDFHPTYIEIKEYIKEEKNVAASAALSADADDLLSFFIQKLEERKPDFKLPESPKKWLQEIDRMIRIDKRDPKKIRAMIDWIHRDPFWSTTILSTKKLRQQYDQIELQAMRKSEGNNVQKNKEFALRLKNKYSESYKNLVFREKYVGNAGTSKELSLNLPHENFKKSFVSMFGINWNDLSESDKK